MISDWSRDTENWSNDTENSALHHMNKYNNIRNMFEIILK